MSHEEGIRELTQKLVHAWETGETGILDEIILPDAQLCFDMFGGTVSIEELKMWMSRRARRTTYTRFDIMSFMCAIHDGKCRDSFSVDGIFAEKVNEKWEHLVIEAEFCNDSVLTESGWKYKKIQCRLSDVNALVAPMLYSSGLSHIEGRGDISFIENWKKKMPDDRIGWYPDSQFPMIVPELEAPWIVYPQHEEKSEERQIEELFYKYAYAMDKALFTLEEDVFTKDVIIHYFDAQPWDLRTATELLKSERQAISRCVHTGRVDNIVINGDYATSDVHVQGTHVPDEIEITDELIQKRWYWGRYTLDYKKENGKWKIHRMYFYNGFHTVDE